MLRPWNWLLCGFQPGEGRQPLTEAKFQLFGYYSTGRVAIKGYNPLIL